MYRKWPYLLLAISLLISFLQIPSVQGQDLDDGVEGIFMSSRIFESSRPISKGLGIGDPDSDGMNEILFTDYDGNVLKLETAPAGEMFASSVIWREEGAPGGGRALLDLEIGDVLPDIQGEEIIVGGDTGRVTAIYMTDGNWDSSVLYDGPNRIFDLKVADIDPAPGNEILFVSNMMDQQDSDPYVRYIHSNGLDWSLEEIPIFDTGNVIEVGDCDPDLEGDEIWVTTNGFEGALTNSSLLCLHDDGNGWNYDVVYNNPTSLISKVNIGDLHSGIDGKEVMISEMTGWCKIIWKGPSGFVTENVFKAETDTGSSSALEASGIGDFNPLHEGDEAVVSGYYDKVTEVRESDGGLAANLAWEAPLEDLRLEITGVGIGEVSDSFSGNEVIVSSLQGWVEMIYFKEDRIILDAPQDFVEVAEGGVETFNLGISAVGSVSGVADISITGPEDLNLVYPETVTLAQGESSFVEVMIDADTTDIGTRFEQLDIDVYIGDTTAAAMVDVRVLESDGRPSLDFNPSTGNIIPFEGDSITTTITLLNGNHYGLEVEPVAGFDVEVDDAISMGEEATMILTVTGDPAPGQIEIIVDLVDNGINMGRGIFPVNVISLKDAVRMELTEMDDEPGLRVVLQERYPVDDLNVEISVGGDVILERVLDIEPFEAVFIELDAKDVSRGNLSASVSSRDQAYTTELGTMDVVPTEDEDDEYDYTYVILLGILVAVLLILTVYLYMGNKRMKRECEEEKSEDGPGLGRRRM